MIVLNVEKLEVIKDEPIEIDINTIRRKIIKERIIQYKEKLYQDTIKLTYSNTYNKRLENLYNKNFNESERWIDKFTEKLTFKDKEHCIKYWDKLMVIVLKKYDSIIWRKD
jgi:hypothetical protein